MSMTSSAGSALEAEGALTAGPHRSSAPVAISGQPTLPRRPGPPLRCERTADRWLGQRLTGSPKAAANDAAEPAPRSLGARTMSLYRPVSE